MIGLTPVMEVALFIIIMIHAYRLGTSYNHPIVGCILGIIGFIVLNAVYLGFRQILYVRRRKHCHERDEKL